MTNSGKPARFSISCDNYKHGNVCLSHGFWMENTAMLKEINQSTECKWTFWPPDNEKKTMYIITGLDNTQYIWHTYCYCNWNFFDFLILSWGLYKLFHLTVNIRVAAVVYYTKKEKEARCKSYIFLKIHNYFLDSDQEFAIKQISYKCCTISHFPMSSHYSEISNTTVTMD